MTDKEWDLEQVYDNEIAPLMTQIINICKRVNMPVVATFQYAAREDDYSFCSTVIIDRPREATERISRVEEALLRGTGLSNEQPLMLTVRDGEGRVISMTAVIHD